VPALLIVRAAGFRPYPIACGSRRRSDETRCAPAHFEPGRLIAVTGDAVCKATDKTYRLDTAAARAFLDDFVALPS
jgi:hypothetical protein